MRLRYPGLALIRLPLPNLSEGEHVLSAASSHYLCRVLRRGPGDRFIAFDKSFEADGVVIDETRVRVDGLRAAAVVAENDLVLVYGLAKGDKVDAVVRDATELGATRIIVAQTARGVVKATRDKTDRWRRIAEQAARQSGRADPPVVEGVLPWSDALRHAGCDARFCLDPHAIEPLGRVLPPAIGSSIAFAVGAEGGLTEEEIAVAAQQGWVPTSLGRFVLRTETVAAAVLGAIRILSAG